METRRICLTAAFDGTDFQGWQIQDNGRTVQGVLEEVLGRMHRHEVRVIGAGRTDSGVHARGMTAHFNTDIASIPAERFVPALNGLLPRDVRIVRSTEAAPDFHARFDARWREYRYMLCCGSADPHARRFSLFLDRRPSVRRLNRYAAAAAGEHDFSAFCAAGDLSDSKNRRIMQAVWVPFGRDRLEFRIRGTAFLWKMVRSLVGTMLELERDAAPETAMSEILQSRDRSAAGTTAPARGLHLWRVNYEQ